MGIGASILLIAVGAILEWGVDVSTSGFNLHTIGIILMVVGAIGLVVSLIMFAPRRRTSRAVTYDEGYAAPEGRRVVREETYRDGV